MSDGLAQRRSVILNKRILIANGDMIISHRRGKLYFQKNFKDTPKKICDISFNGIRNIFSKVSIFERLLRLEPRFAFPVDQNCFYLSCDGFIYHIDIKKGRIRKEHEYRKKMHNPLNACMVKGLFGFSDGLYYGEYWGNTKHEPVSIWHGINGVWRKVYTFPAGTILHIHAVIPDYVNNELLVLTGDDNNESNIWAINSTFSNIQKLCGGKQQFRSCSAFPDGDSIYYTTDTPHEENSLYCFSRKEKRLRKICSISGPCIYSTILINQQFGKTFAFSTSVESDSRFAGTWKYRLSVKVAPGVVDRYSRIYIGDFLNGFSELLKFRKDSLPYQLFQFGNIRFPHQELPGYLICCPQSVKKYHGKTLIIKLN